MQGGAVTAAGIPRPQRTLRPLLAEVRSNAERSGRSGLFEDLKGLISLDATMVAYDQIAARHGLTEEAVKAAAHHLRQSFRAALRGLIAETVNSFRATRPACS